MGTHKLSRYTTSLSSRAAMDRLTSKQVSQSQVITACRRRSSYVHVVYYTTASTIYLLQGCRNSS